jgi:hypothetical protein
MNKDDILIITEPAHGLQLLINELSLIIYLFFLRVPYYAFLILKVNLNCLDRLFVKV